MKLLSLEPESSASANSAIPAKKKMVGGDGFEPSKSVTADLQSAPFGHSGTRPYMKFIPRVRRETIGRKEPRNVAHVRETGLEPA